MSGTITKTTDRFTETAIDDEIVIMSLDNGDFFSLTGTACDIWSAIDGTRDREQLVDHLAASYNADRAEIASDVDSFLGELREAGFIAA